MLPELYNHLPPPLITLQLLGIVSLAYTVILVVGRLYFSPISNIPGPRIAAATALYEFYYNVVKGGKFFLKIQQLHEEYGKSASFHSHSTRKNQKSSNHITHRIQHTISQCKEKRKPYVELPHENTDRLIKHVKKISF